MIIDENLLCCPVSLNTYLNPRVLPCGHTIDLNCMIKYNKKICPLCSNKFSQSILSLPVNWVVVNLLDLKIQSNLNILSYFKFANKDFIKKNTELISLEIFETEFINIIHDINKYSKKGIYNYHFDINKRFKKYSSFQKINLCNELEKKLKDLNYKVNITYKYYCFGVLSKKIFIVSWK